MADGGWTIEFLEENAFIAIRRLEADAKKSQAYQPLTCAGWCRFSLAVLLRLIRLGPSQLMDGAKGFDFVALSRKPPAWSLSTTSDNLLT